MRKLALLLLSLLALGPLGLVACGGGDADETTAASATPIADNPRITYDALAADPADNKPCGASEGWGLTVVEGDISCREARRLMHRVAYNRDPYQWGCIGPEGATGGYEVCTNMPGTSSRIVIKVRFGREAVTLHLGGEEDLLQRFCSGTSSDHAEPLTYPAAADQRIAVPRSLTAHSFFGIQRRS